MKETNRISKKLSKAGLSTNDTYDIFISYRREGGADKARILKTELEKRGFSVFLDFDELKDGFFDERIIHAIKSTPIFMILLSQNALDRCGEEGDWVCKEIEYAIKTERHIIPINPDRSFSYFPISTPPFIVKGLQQHQMSEIMFGQLFNVSMDKMVAERIEPALAKRPKRRSFKWMIVACVIALILMVSVVAVLMRGGRRQSPNEQVLQTSTDIVIEQETQQSMIEEALKQEACKASKQPSSSQEEEVSSPKRKSSVVDKTAIKKEIDEAFELQFNLHRNKYPHGNNAQNMQAYQKDANALHQTLLQLIKDFKTKYNPDDSAEMLWIDGYCKDVMAEQYAQLNQYWLECANDKINQADQVVDIHNSFVREVFDVYQSSLKNNTESVVRSLVGEGVEEVDPAILDTVMSNLKTIVTESTKPQIDDIITKYQKQYPNVNIDEYAALAQTTLESLFRQVDEAIARYKSKSRAQ